MATGRVERRLSAILAADVVGYSRLMERDEAGTFARLKELRKALVEPVLAQHGGRFVDLKGDGAIVEFQSAVEAVEAAVEIQRAMQAQDAELPEAERIRYRIGINLGDVIVDGGTIYGDGVNVAARIEALCEPGGVWLSRSVYNQVRGKLDLAFASSGLHQVKNISEAVETFRVALDGTAPPRRPPAAATERPIPRVRRFLPLAAIAAILALVMAAGAWGLWPTRAVAGRPGIAVLPFTNYGGDEATGRLADGITEDIITDLAHFRDLDVIARNSTEGYKGRPMDVRQVGNDLRVAYVLEGSIQRQGDRIRVTAQLIDARTDAHVWADRWDRPAGDLFAVQTEVAEKVAVALGGDLTMGQITRAELLRAKRKTPSSLTAYEYFLLGEESKASYTKFDQGIDYLTKAIALDPTLARAYSIRGWLYYFTMWYGADATAMIANMVRDEEKAVELDPQDAASVAALGFARNMERRWGEAEGLLRTAVDMGPGNAHVLAIAATGFAYLGKAAEAAGFADRALRLDPRMTPGNLNGLKDAYYMARRYEGTRSRSWAACPRRAARGTRGSSSPPATLGSAGPPSSPTPRPSC
jgi:TolB-like protein/class 3 adenylate cyclase